MVKKAAGFIANLIETHMLIRRSVLIVLLAISVPYAVMGLWILSKRPDGHITANELALILAFAGVQSAAYYSYAKARGGK